MQPHKYTLQLYAKPIKNQFYLFIIIKKYDE